jgi:Domain of unknown function (DUF4383)
MPDMQTRLFTLVLGLFYVLFGVAGFISGLRSAPPASAPHVDVTDSYGYLFGTFPVNVLENALHIVIGLGGIIMGARLILARYYCQFLFLVLGALTFMGFLPTLDTVWGYMPILSSETWLHAATAIAAAYFGWVAPESTRVEPAYAGTGH